MKAYVAFIVSFCPGVSRHAFEYFQCFLTMDVDGTFTREISSLTVLLVISVDADNYVVMIPTSSLKGNQSHRGGGFFHIFTQRCRTSIVQRQPS